MTKMRVMCVELSLKFMNSSEEYKVNECDMIQKLINVEYLWIEIRKKCME